MINYKEILAIVAIFGLYYFFAKYQCSKSGEINGKYDQKYSCQNFDSKFFILFLFVIIFYVAIKMTTKTASA